MNQFRAFTSSLATAASNLTKDLQSSFDDRPATQGKQYTIGGKVVEQDKLLSEGGFGFVYLAREQGGNASFVLKRMLCQDRERFELACREVELYEKLPVHPNLVKYYGHIIEKDSKHREVILLLELCPGGHLYDLMLKHPNGVPESEIMRVLRDVTAGLVALHSMDPPVQHRDLKLENVLLNSSGKWVLLDFGSWSSHAPDLSKLPRDELMKFEETVERYTTLMYRPPEMADLYKGFAVSGKVDMWMLGCILFTMINKKHPFQNASNLAIVNCRYVFCQDECKRYNPKLTQLCTWLLAQNPIDRPSSVELQKLLQEWDSRSNESLPIPQSVSDRIEKDARLYGIPVVARSLSAAAVKSVSAPPMVVSTNTVWTENTTSHSKNEWKADFGAPVEDLLNLDSEPQPTIQPSPQTSVCVVDSIPDLLG